jgi:hypothetical protein
VTARSSAAAARPARSAAGCAARWSTAIPRVRCLGVVPPAVCTHTTSGTGKTAAAPPSFSTWYWLVCPYHHRLHHRGIITISGPAHQLVVADSAGQQLRPGSLARPPNKPPPAVAPCPGPTGERADWWWYEPFQPQPPPTNN